MKKIISNGSKQILEQIAGLTEKQKHYEKKAMECESQISALNYELINIWPNFLENCRNTDFFIQNKFPTTEEIIRYYNQDTKNGISLPLYEYGYFDIKELLIIIKLLYSYKRDKEYEVLTFGNLHLDHTGPTDSDRSHNAYLRFLVGNDKTLEEFYQYNQCFFEENQKLHKMMCEYSQIRFAGKSNMIVLTPNRSVEENSLGISCEGFGYYGQKLTGDGINYSDEWQKRDACAMFSDRYNIFSNYPLVGLTKHIRSRSGVGGLFDFPIGFRDGFISSVLMSIVIYKRNIGKVDLDNEDYHYIFYELFGEDVDIAKEVKKDIPPELRYVRKREIN